MAKATNTRGLKILSSKSVTILTITGYNAKR